MTPAERKLVVLMLNRYADDLGLSGCNDFDLVKDGCLSREESLEIQRLLNDWCCLAPDQPEKTLVNDGFVCRCLADKLEDDTNEP